MPTGRKPAVAKYVGYDIFDRLGAAFDKWAERAKPTPGKDSAAYNLGCYDTTGHVVDRQQDAVRSSLLLKQIGHGSPLSVQAANGCNVPHGCGNNEVVWVDVLGRRSGCVPPLDIAICPCRPSFFVRILAMDRHRQRAADGLRVAKGHVPFATDGKGFHPQSVGRSAARLDPALSTGTTDHAIPWSRLTDEAPCLVKGGERIPGSIVSGYALDYSTPSIAFCCALRSNFARPERRGC